MPDQSEFKKKDANQLALERTFLAYERTLMAWTRTSVSLVSFGFTLFKFFEYMAEREPEKYVHHFLGPRTVGILMIGIGTFMLILATIMHKREINELRKSYPEAPFSQSFILAVLISILGSLMFAAALISH